MKIERGTVAVVTGAASGIGQGCVLEFARRGADVVVADINDERMAETAKLVEQAGGSVLTVHCDVREDADLASVRDQALQRFGRVDVLMNNAGVVLMGPPESIPIDDWRWIFDVNVFGLIRGVQAFVPYFQEQGRGHVVNTASIAGRYAYTFDAIPYITSKFAAYGFSEGLYLYLKAQGIGMSVLCPGLVATNLGEGMRFAGSSSRDGWIYLPEDISTATVEDIGVLVADAVEKEQFMIYTDPGDELKMLERYRDITAALEAQLAVMPKPPKVVH